MTLYESTYSIQILNYDKIRNALHLNSTFLYYWHFPILENWMKIELNELTFIRICYLETEVESNEKQRSQWGQIWAQNELDWPQNRSNHGTFSDQISVHFGSEQQGMLLN